MSEKLTINKEKGGLVKGSASPKELLDFLLAEYTALRSEILKHAELQQQLVTLALIATGTFIAFGSITATLAYPVLAMFLAAAWAQKDFRIRQLSTYIEKRIEEKFVGSNVGWEHIHASSPGVGKLGSLSLFASRGVFIGTQVLILFVSLLKTDFPIEDIVLLALDGLAVLFTLFVLRRHKLDIEKFL